MADNARAVPTSDGRHQQFIEEGWIASVPFTTVSAHWLSSGENRLDGGYYTAEVGAALRAVNDCGLEVFPLGQVTADIFILGRFRRIYASEVTAGWPYLSASEALSFRPTSSRYIAREHAPKMADQHFAKPGWILVSASGTVGRMVIATERLSNYFLTHDLIRIVPKDLTPYAGYLYAYLSSRVGQALVVKDQYGSAIKHLEPHHLAGVPVPLLPEPDQAEIHAIVIRAFALRDEANHLLDEADEMLHQELRLPCFDENLVPYLPAPITPRQGIGHPDIPQPRAFTIKASELNERLDVSYHVPVVRAVTELLYKGEYPPVPLSSLTDEISLPPRFKRIYVSKGYGVPFIRPSHLPQMRPYDLGQISRYTKVLDSLMLHLGDVLITTDGTVGRIGIVTSRIAGWAGSNNIARIIYGNDDMRNGFLAAFLSTPYGFHQLVREIYGGVVDHIEVPHIASVLVPDAPDDIQIEIGKRVVSAYEKKDEAWALEEVAIGKIENVLLHSRS